MQIRSFGIADKIVKNEKLRIDKDGSYITDYQLFIVNFTLFCSVKI